jgi:hypothetical protein
MSLFRICEHRQIVVMMVLESIDEHSPLTAVVKMVSGAGKRSSNAGTISCSTGTVRAFKGDQGLGKSIVFVKQKLHAVEVVSSNPAVPTIESRTCAENPGTEAIP